MTQATTSNMALNRTSIYKTLPSYFTSALKDFQTSQSPFRLLQTLTPKTPNPQPPSPQPSPAPATLLILDSSFNPPSTAHLTLARTALAKTSNSIASTPGPHRLLLLFSTMNADKAPSAASFAQRLTLMTLFAHDLQENLLTSASTHECPAIDIGVTTAPFYTDKSAAIASSPEGKHWYPSAPRHIHLLGYDTLTRFFAAKYYAEKADPPLSALQPYFGAGHQLRATLRPDDAYGSEDEQRAFLRRLADGEMEGEGGQREWAELVELVEATPRAGVSSTVIRRAAKQGDWAVVEDLCTEGVAAWVREEKLYEEDDRGAKMA
ncbi:hypothetical protein Q7P37_009054 [Cladosporium fusiforme]